MVWVLTFNDNAFAWTRTSWSAYCLFSLRSIIMVYQLSSREFLFFLTVHAYILPDSLRHHGARGKKDPTILPLHDHDHHDPFLCWIYIMRYRSVLVEQSRVNWIVLVAIASRLDHNWCTIVFRTYIWSFYNKISFAMPVPRHASANDWPR